MFRAFVGQHEGTDTLHVIDAVIAQCKAQCDGLVPIAGLVFAADHFDHDLAVKQINAAFPGLELAGCTSSGEMSSAMGFSQDSMCLMLFVAETDSIASGLGRDLSSDPGNAVRRAVDDARSRLEGTPAVCLIFPGAVSGEIESVLSSSHQVLGPECLVFGGVPSIDDFENSQIRQFSRQAVCSDAVSVLLFSGPLKIASVVCNSWDPVGYPSEIEESEGNRVKRIGGRSALQYFRDAFGPYAVPLPEMPLAVFDDENNFYLRSALGFDEKDESVDYTTAIPAGCTVQLTEATAQKINTSNRRCLDRLMADIGQDWLPQAAILFSCTSRRWIMGMRTAEELTAARETLSDDLALAGFYTFGEIAATAHNPEPKLHNCTLVAVLLGEAASSAKPTPAKSRPRVSDDDGDENRKLLAKKLKRARESQHRLQLQKESFTNVLKKMSADLTQANRRIERQNRLLTESLTLAQEVQLSLLPAEAPPVDGFDIAGRSLYCDETGGDYIDFIPGGNSTAVVVGDVSGHGVSAALLMTTARAFLRMRNAFTGSPAALVTDVNRALSRDVEDSGRFMTLMYLKLNLTDKTVTWVRAGHEPALRYRPDTDEFSELRGEGMALGVIEAYQYRQHTTTPLRAGEIIVLGTDGITETRNPDGRFFGRKRLMEIVRKNARRPAARIVKSCFQYVRDFRAGLNREDDETLVVVKAL